jgi:glycosyltransferase involved in cell wall biosynthesis
MPYFSIITPTYNRATLLVETIKSVLDQTFKDFELIIVDDGSTDNTKEAVQPFLSTRIKYFYQQNKRQGAARNLGIKNASGEFVAFLDHDDLWSPIFLETYYKFIQNNPHAQWIHGAFFWFNENYFWKGNTYPVEGWVWKYLLKGNLINTLTIAVRRKLLDNIKFDENSLIWPSEDWEFNFRLAIASPCYFQPLPLLFMRNHITRTSTTTQLVQMEKAYFFALDKIIKNPFMHNKPAHLKRSALSHGYLFIAENAYGRNLQGQLIKNIVKAAIIYPFIIFTVRWSSMFIKIFIPAFLRNKLRNLKQKNLSKKNNNSQNDIRLPKALEHL